MDVFDVSKFEKLRLRILIGGNSRFGIPPTDFEKNFFGELLVFMYRSNQGRREKLGAIEE